MARRVFVHIGLPKTGTTYLQSVLWANRDGLRREGVLLPGAGHREHLWAALDVQERPRLASRHPRAPGTWQRLAKELRRWDETGLVSHEFFCGASRQQAESLVADLAPAEVHVIVTARHSAGMLTAGWQERVKNGGSETIDAVTEKRGAGSEFSWRTWDLAGVLRRWGGVVPPSQVHVLPMPPKGSAPDLHWRNFAQVIGSAGDYSAPEEAANTSLGVVQVELLRRINSRLEGFGSALDRGRWIRGYLAEEQLALQDGVPFALTDEQWDDCRARSRRAVRLIREQGYDVVGDLDSLLVPDRQSAERTPDTVTDAELADAAVRLVADMLPTIRDLARDPGERRHDKR